jgi:hypothetical protein
MLALRFVVIILLATHACSFVFSRVVGVGDDNYVDDWPAARRSYCDYELPLKRARSHITHLIYARARRR